MPASAALADADAVMDAIRGTPGLEGRIVQVAPGCFSASCFLRYGAKAARGNRRRPRR